jgi:predicted metal-dependent hydrolase
MTSSRPRKKKPEDLDATQIKQLELSPEDWEEFSHGVRLFNSGKFWNSHEAWEQVWMRHDEDERLFFQGIIQLAAAYHQLIVKKNFRGLMNNFEKAYQKLVIFQPEYLGVSVKPLIKFIEEGKKEAERVGPDDLEAFNGNLIPKLQFHKPLNPDFLVESRSMVRSDRFLEGVALFNKGYYWEAHEVWEDVWRNEEDDAKTFAQGFVQVAAANSFVNQAKLTSAKYLFEKALEKFHQFPYSHCGVDVQKLIQDIESSLGGFHGANGDPSYKKQLLVTTVLLQTSNEEP